MAARHILVVDDEPEIRNLVRDILEDEGYTVSVAEGGEAARSARRTRRPDLILLDIWMEDIDGISLLREWSESGDLPCPVVMMSGHGTVETAVEATRLGAYDFIEKPISLAKLLLTIERAFESARLQQENIDLRQRIQPVLEPVGKSDAMEQLREQARKIARHNSWVLISGEPGSGRETYARYLHAHSSRSDRPFVDVGVSAITQGGGRRVSTDPGAITNRAWRAPMNSRVSRSRIPICDSSPASIRVRANRTIWQTATQPRRRPSQGSG